MKILLAWMGLAAILLLCALPLTGADAPVSIDVYPKVALAPPYGTTTVRVRWRIARNSDNRSFNFAMASDNGDFFSSSQTLNGVEEPVTFPVCTEANPRPCFREVHAGRYALSVCVYRVNSNPVCAKTTLEVR